MSKPSQKKQLRQRRRGKAVRREVNVRRNNTAKTDDAPGVPARAVRPVKRVEQ